MASTGFEALSGEQQSQQERKPANGTLIAKVEEADEAVRYSPTDGNSLKPVHDYTHRRLKSRHIQLIGIGGCVIISKPMRNCGQLNLQKDHWDSIVCSDWYVHAFRQ